MATSQGEVFEPPPHPPPLLSDSQLAQLSRDGHLPIELSPPLQKLYDELFANMSEFFQHPEDVKSATYPCSHGTERGYYHVVDEKQYVTLRCSTAPDSELERNAAALWRGTASMLHRVLVDLSLRLEIPLGAWDPVLDSCLTMPLTWDNDNLTLLRMFQYLPHSGKADKHTDNGLLTLCVGAGKGLQVWNKCANNSQCPGHWKDAEGPTLLIGSTLHLMSRQRLPLGLHRVVENPEGRSSIVFALRPSAKHQIDATRFGGEGIVNMREFWNDIQGKKYNVNAHQHIREQQLERQKAMVRARDADVQTHAQPEKSKPRHTLRGFIKKITLITR